MLRTFGNYPQVRLLRPAVTWTALALAVSLVAGCGASGPDAATRAQTEQELQQLRASQQEMQRLQAENQELPRLRRDNQEVHRLQKETQGLPDLRREHEQLRGELEALKPTRPRT